MNWHLTGGRQTAPRRPSPATTWPRTSRRTKRFTTSRNQSGGWLYQILPYVEQDAVWRLTDVTTLNRALVPTAQCPSRGPGLIEQSPQRHVTHYAGSMGNVANENTYPQNGMLVRTFLNVATNGNPTGSILTNDNNGGSALTVLDVADGTSNTP